jgi:hypothetical protein
MSALGGGFNRSMQHCCQFIGRRFESQGFSRSLVQAQRNLVQIRL